MTVDELKTLADCVPANDQAGADATLRSHVRPAFRQAIRLLFDHAIARTILANDDEQDRLSEEYDAVRATLNTQERSIMAALGDEFDTLHQCVDEYVRRQV